ncbi:MAG: hypothetical protein JST80_06130 [Bdellovibrionales bacterium]|nr:hypothetical protein [Bdellovibrionales bacterium]
MPKMKKPAAKAVATAKTAKTTKKAEPKVKLSVKADKKSQKLEVKAVQMAAGQANEEEDEDVEMTTAGNGGGSNNVALSMAAATADTSAGSLKNFRHHPDIENFYRFIFENDLRYEALEIIDMMAVQRVNKKAVKAAKARPN